MDCAYHFPFEVKIDRAHAHMATRMALDADYDTLVQAARHDRLRCCYIECLGRLKTVRLSRESNDLRCFAHVDPASISPPCPYRVESREYVDPTTSLPYPREHNVRKLIENDLRVQLERKLDAPGRTVIGSGYHEHEPLIRISGIGEPLRIRALAPGCEKLWSEPFDGTNEGEEVLFFVITPDAPRLQRRFIDEHLLQRRPAILIQPSEKEGEQHTWIATSALGDGAKPVRPFDEIDLIRIDYRRLLGVNRPAESFFLPTSYRRAIERIDAHLAGGGLTSPANAILRSFAGRLLLQGAAIRSPEFGHEEPDVRELGALFEDPELRRVCDGDPILASIREHFLADALAGLQRTIEASQEMLATSREQHATAEANLSAAREALADVEQKRADLAVDLAATQMALSQERSRRKTLEQSVIEAKTHWLVRLDDVIHAH